MLERGETNELINYEPGCRKFPAFAMVHVYLNRESYLPGDELKIAVCPSKSDSIQLLSFRCIGYIRFPTSIVKDVPDRAKYAFKDKPIGPIFPDDSILLWLTPNFPVHVDFANLEKALVRFHVPYFVPPSIKGGLFEICHYVEVSILVRGEFEMRTKQLPLSISSILDMPKLMAPAIGDGYEQVDFNVPPALQSTPHGKRATAWEVARLIHNRVSGRSMSAIFKSRRGFKISFNNQHAVEIMARAEWANDSMIAEQGTIMDLSFRFDQPGVLVKLIISRLVRTERILFKDDQVNDSILFEAHPLAIAPYVAECTQAIPVPYNMCPTFTSDLVSVQYRLEFDLRAVDAESLFLDPVTWSLPLIVRQSEDAGEELSPDPWPQAPVGSIPPIFDPELEIPSPGTQGTIRASEIDAVISNSSIHPGSMRFTIYSS